MHRMFRAAASVVAIFCVFLSQAAFGATITVDDGTDSLYHKGGCTLRQAVEAANNDTAVDGCSAGDGADTIDFDESLAGTTIDLAIVGDITAGQSALGIYSDITILGDAFDGITISIADQPVKGIPFEMRHFYVGFGPDCPDPKGPCKGATSPALTLENVTVTNGNTHGGNGGSGSGGGGGAAGMGGAIFNDQSTVSILNSTLANNSATGGDGGSGDSELDKSQSGRGGGGGGGSSGNGAGPSGASGGSGGPPNGGSPSGGNGGFGGGGAGGDGYDCVSKGDDDDDGDNAGSGGFGGGGGAGGEGTQFCPGVKSHLGGDGGNGGFGGGGGGRGAQDANLSKGEAPAGEGGFGGGEGLQAFGGGGAGMGGAVFSWFGTVNVTNSTISDNTAAAGESACESSPVKGCVFPTKGIANARGLGGGIFMHDGTLDMNNTTMSSNAAIDGSSVDDKGFGDNGDGGAIYIFDTTFDKSGAQVFIDNSILADSNADDDFDTNAGLTKGPDAKGDIGSGSNNIIRDNEGFAGGYITDDPLLGNLTDNGGPTDTHLPEGIPDGFSKGQSAAIGGGNNATCEDEDQRHFIPRPVGANCDIGSVEVGAAADDGDDVDAEVEDGAPNDGDGNDDGTIDSIQPQVASLPAGAGGGYVTVEITEDCGQLRNVMTVNAASLPPNIGSDGQPRVYPHGLVEFEMPCESAIVEVTFHAAQNAGSGYDKYGPVTPGDVGTTAWYSFSDPGFATQTGPNVWTLDLEDGRLGDDTDGTDDTIFDQGGPFFPGGPIPAADWRGLLLLALLILSAGGLARRNRQTS